MVTRRPLAVLAMFRFVFLSRAVHAQSFGVELNNTLMPAAGGMAGVSVAQPQDLTSAINGNPATLTQFQGTQFIFGGAWAEPTFSLRQSRNIPTVGPPLIEPFSSKSTAPGVMNVLPGANLDVMAGGMFRDTERLGNFTTTSILSYWIGLGLTWQFGRGACCRPDVRESWCAG